MTEGGTASTAASDVPLRIGGQSTEVTRRPGALDALRRELDERRAIRLPGFLAPNLLGLFRARLESESFEPAFYESVGTEMLRARGVVVEPLLFLMNDPVLLDAVSLIGGRERIGSFTGRIYRLEAERGGLDGWHSDAVEGRLLALSVDLSARPFEGGVLEMRDRASQRGLARFPNTVPGDALLFRVASDLEHRVTPVTGENPKTAFAGWFFPGPRLLVPSGT